MKKIVLLRIVAVLLMTSLVPPLLAEVGTITYNASYNSSDMILGTDTLGGVTYTTVTYGDLTNGGQPGAPSLPIDYLRFSVPANATNFTVTAVKFNNLLQTIGNLVYPCQLPRMVSGNNPWVITPPDNSIYNSGSFYPSASGCVWVDNEGFLAGENHIVTVAVMPISFRRQMTGMMSRQLSLAKTITLTLSYELSDSLAMYPIVRNDTTLRNEGYRLAQSLVVNPEGVTGNAPLKPLPIDSINFNPRGGDGLNGLGDVIPWNPNEPLDTLPSYQMATYPYLIVTTPALKNSVRRIAALKQMKGYNVKVVTMDEVLNSSFAGDGDEIQKPDGTYQVVDTSPAGKLRQYLRNCYRIYNTKYVLLVGTDVPYKYRHINNGNYQNYDVPTDLYYSELNGNWHPDSVIRDLCAELYVGRILSKTSSQIENFTDKLLKYEMNPGNGDYSYLKRAFFLEGRDFKGILDSAKLILSTIFPDQIIINDNTFNKYPKGRNVIETLRNQPVGLTCPFNHGDTTRILVYGDINYNDSIKYFIHSIKDESLGSGLNSLHNQNYPMLFYAPSCTTTPYDNVDGINMGESFTTGKGYGGPIYIGYTRAVWSNNIESILKQFAKELKNGYYILGEADALSKSNVSNGCCDESIMHAYLGDPSLEIWTDTPQQFSGIGISRTNNSVTITGINADSVDVVYRSHDNLSKKMIVGMLPVTFNQVSPNGVIMLSKHNYIPYITPMILQNVSLNKSHYAIASDVTAGYYVDSIRTPGDVIVKSGVNYEIEASGKVTLEDGFKVEKGAIFAVYPSSF